MARDALLCASAVETMVRSPADGFWEGIVTTRLLAGLLLAACVAFGPPDRAHAGRAIPGDNLSYPVLITLENSNGATLGFGSGFYFNDDDAVYLITAKHVIIAGLPDPAAAQAI